MDEKYSALFTPWKIGNVEIKNRIVQCSMGGTSLFGWLEPCHFDKEAANFLLNRAQDGVGLVLPGMQCVRDTMGRRWLWQNKKMFKELADYMVEYHKTGSKLFIQLAAGFGRSMAVAPLDGHSEQQQGARRPCQARHRRQLLLRFRFRYPEPLAGGHALPPDDRRRDPRDGRCVRQDREAAA